MVFFVLKVVEFVTVNMLFDFTLELSFGNLFQLLFIQRLLKILQIGCITFSEAAGVVEAGVEAFDVLVFAV